MLRLHERRPDPDPERVPPRARPRVHHVLGRAPASEIVRARERDSRVGDAAEPGRRTVKEDPLAVDPLGKHGGVLVLGRDDHPMTLDGDEILRGREIDGRAGGAVRRARDHEAIKLVDPHGARILEAPLLALHSLSRLKQRLGIHSPPVDPVRRAGDREVRHASLRLDAREQDRLAADDRRRRVEDDVDRSRPVRSAQDRVAGVAAEELALLAPHARVGGAAPGHAATPRRAGRRSTRGRPAASSTCCARWKASVDSAPSFAFTASSPSPSLQPPVAKS